MKITAMLIITFMLVECDDKVGQIGSGSITNVPDPSTGLLMAAALSLMMLLYLQGKGRVR